MSQATILSISLPSDLRARLDAEARRQRRPRSFVVAQALEVYLAQQGREAFAEGRERTLREALALSPAERVGLAEEPVAGAGPGTGVGSSPGPRASTRSRSMSAGAGRETGAG